MLVAARERSRLTSQEQWARTVWRLGIDRDDANVADAIRQYGGMKNLRFENVDILAFGDRFKNRFDIVTAARTIQWISEPQRAISNMKEAAKQGGRVIVLDYNLDETRWEPEPPVEFSAVLPGIPRLAKRESLGQSDGLESHGAVSLRRPGRCGDSPE